MPKYATSSASRLPKKLSSRPSTIICTIRRARLAPSALRMASSRCRAMARVSIRLARLAQASSRISPDRRQQDQQIAPQFFADIFHVHRKHVGAKPGVERGILLLQPLADERPFPGAPAPARRRDEAARRPASSAGSAPPRCAAPRGS